MKANELLNIASEIEVTNMSNDSREMKANGLYFAIEGLTVDGHDYIQSAVDNGAVVIVHTKDVEPIDGVEYVKVEDVYEAYNQISSKFFDYPADKLIMVGTTGTNGKSTTSWILDDILNTTYKSGYIGTIGIKTDDTLKESTFTTLLPHQYNEIFSDMVTNGKEYAAIEVSSQGLDQHRTDFISFDYAIMTNLTHEHLDYHITMENYLKAKAILFEQVKPDGISIINNDDENSAEYLKQVAKGKVVTYGINNDSDVMAKEINLTPTHTEFMLSYFGEEYPITTNLVGEFNVYNLLGALAVAIDSGVKIEVIQEVVQKLSQVEGRMEIIENDKGINVIVDYAHTPDGFTQVFKYIETITEGRVISVFGCAGKRDTLKRPVLGEIADKASDIIILTEEDSKTEDPREIANDIQKGIKKCEVEYIEDRESAIIHAFEIAKRGDTIALLAKGQEAFMKNANGIEPYLGDVEIAKREAKN